MLINPITGKAYQDLFDSVDKYQNILFNTGVNIQSRELNEMLSMMADRIKRLGSVLFNDGSIMKGGGLIINDTKTSVKMLPIDIFISGIIHSIDVTDLAITGIGTEILGVELYQQIITSFDDPKLVDPAPGKNFGLPGADRLKITAKWAVNSGNAFPVYTLIDGALKQEKYAPESDSINSLLARRTNDESGSYTVSGLTGYLVDYDADNFQLVIEAGKGYVQGWEISKPSPDKTIILPKPKTTAHVNNETKTYHTGTSDYKINSQPVKQITQLTAQVSHTMTMTKGATNTSDTIPVQFQPVSSITSITGYTSGTDYTLDGNDVDWSAGGSEPAPGSTYTITFVYTKTMVSGSDYQLYNGPDGDYARFLAGDRPVDSSNFQYSYDYYLSRNDIFYMTKDGVIGITYGQDGVTPPLPPMPVGVLVLGDLDLSANCTALTAKVNNYDPKRLTMSEIRQLRDRMDTTEYNAAVEDLDNAAAAMDPATTKKAIFTDGFLNTNKVDFGIAGIDLSIDPTTGTLMAPFIPSTKDAISNDTGTARRHNRLATKPYTEVVGLSQLNATQRFNVNEYAVYGRSAIITVNPNQDNWIDSSTVTNIVYRWWWAWTFDWSMDGRSSTSVSISTQMILDETEKYIRERSVTVIGYRFIPNSDNIHCTFDGIEVTLTPAGMGTEGTIPGTMRADGNGTFSATFTIPPNVPVGTREIVAWNEV